MISRYFDEIAQDTGKYCYGVKDTLYALDIGAVEILVVYENLETTRFTIRNNTTQSMFDFLEIYIYIYIYFISFNISIQIDPNSFSIYYAILSLLTYHS